MSPGERSSAWVLAWFVAALFFVGVMFNLILTNGPRADPAPRIDEQTILEYQAYADSVADCGDVIIVTSKQRVTDYCTDNLLSFAHGCAVKAQGLCIMMLSPPFDRKTIDRARASCK